MRLQKQASNRTALIIADVFYMYLVNNVLIIIVKSNF